MSTCVDGARRLGSAAAVRRVIGDAGGLLHHVQSRLDSEVKPGLQIVARVLSSEKG